MPLCFGEELQKLFSFENAVFGIFIHKNVEKQGQMPIDAVKKSFYNV